MTLANPSKNAVPCSVFEIAFSSSKLAPAQKVRSPPLFKTTTAIEGSEPALVIKLVRDASIEAGNPLWGGL